MKKNVMMRVASVLLICVLLTSSVISGTFAKYVTVGSGSDSARVAKWGVTITAQGDAFAKEYASETDGYTANTVISEAKVVAPGTKGSLSEMNVQGTPEVAVRVTYAAELTLAGWQLADSTVYCPIVFIVEGTKYSMEGFGGAYTYTDLDEFIEAVEGAIAACSKDYPANQAITMGSDAPSISWEWAYESGHDSEDTYLGNQASIGNAPTITLAITTTATQIN